MITTPFLPAARASASSLFRSPRKGSKNASQGSVAWTAVVNSRRKKSLAAAVMAPERLRRAGLLLELGHQPRALFEERGQVLVAARDRPGIVTDLLVQLGELLLEECIHMTIRSTNSCTGVCSRRFASRHSSRIAFCCFSGKRRARLRSNFSTSRGIPSLRRRLWPIGYSTTTSARRLPSLNSTVSAFAIERFSGSW